MAKFGLGKSVQGELIRDFHKSGNSIEILSQKTGIDRDTLGQMLDRSLSGRVPVLGKENQESLRSALHNKGDILKGDNVTEPFKVIEGPDWKMEYYHTEIGSRLPDEVTDKEGIKYQVIIHGKEGGESKIYVTSPSWDLGTAMAEVAALMGEYSDFEADGFDIKTFEYMGEE